MEFTGERVIPGQDDVDLFNEHRARYWFARRFAQGKNVLDAACGTGYGSALLAETARAVVGVDVARGALDYARQHFRVPNLRFAQSDCLALPFADGCFDRIVAFEIIEHLDQTEAFLAELRRVLAPAGALILSTPNRLYYTDERQEINPFHRREFSYPEFAEILRSVFPHCAILFQNHVAGIAVSGPGAKWSSQALRGERLYQEEGDTQAIEEARRSAHFFAAVCSSQPLGPIEPLLYVPSAANILREREIHIKQLKHWLAEKDAYVLQLQADYDSKIEWARSLERDLDKARADLARIQADYERDLGKARADLAQLQKEFAERTAWALRLDRDLQLLYSSRWYRLGRNLNLSPVPPSDQGSSDSNQT